MHQHPQPLGRVLLALGESLVVTGTMGWGIALVGPQNGGKVKAWLGMAIYAALAFGAPAGVALNAHGGFAAIAAATMRRAPPQTRVLAMGAYVAFLALSVLVAWTLLGGQARAPRPA